MMSIREFLVLRFWQYLPTDWLKSWWLTRGPFKLINTGLVDKASMDWAERMCAELDLEGE